MSKKFSSKTSSKELHKAETPCLEKLSLDKLSYVGGGNAILLRGLQVSTDNRLI